MLTYLETYLNTFSTRRSCLQPLASTTKSARSLKNSARYWLCCCKSIELLPLQRVITLVKLASAPGNHLSTAVRALESQFSNFSPRSSNSSTMLKKANLTTEAQSHRENTDQK